MRQGSRVCEAMMWLVRILVDPGRNLPPGLLGGLFWGLFILNCQVTEASCFLLEHYFPNIYIYICAIVKVYINVSSANGKSWNMNLLFQWSWALRAMLKAKGRDTATWLWLVYSHGANKCHGEALRIGPTIQRTLLFVA